MEGSSGTPAPNGRPARKKDSAVAKVIMSSAVVAASAAAGNGPSFASVFLSVMLWTFLRDTSPRIEDKFQRYITHCAQRQGHYVSVELQHGLKLAPPPGNSAIWEVMKVIAGVPEGEKNVICILCGSLLTWKAGVRGGGNSNLRSHLMASHKEAGHTLSPCRSALKATLVEEFFVISSSLDLDVEDAYVQDLVRMITKKKEGVKAQEGTAWVDFSVCFSQQQEAAFEFLNEAEDIFDQLESDSTVLDMLRQVFGEDVDLDNGEDDDEEPQVEGASGGEGAAAAGGNTAVAGSDFSVMDTA